MPSTLHNLSVRLRLQRRRHKLLATLGALCVLALVFYAARPINTAPAPALADLVAWWRPTSEPALAVLPETQEKLSHIRAQFASPASAKRRALGHQFYGAVLQSIVDAKPAVEKLDNYPTARAVLLRYELGNAEQPVYLEKYLRTFLQLTDPELEAMTVLHAKMMRNLPEYAPEGLYKGDGIVYVGGGKFNWLALLSIKGLRAAGSQMPVELLVPTLEEYEVELCGRILPSMNAKCIFLPDALFGKSKPTLHFKGYQYKLLAVLLLSFENVLLLDSDNVPVYSPDHLFRKEPFVSKGLIVWPDFWRRSTSVDYYKIAGLAVLKTELLPRYDEHTHEYVPQPNKPKNLDEVPFHERLGAIPDPLLELGQLMMLKRTHMKALLLALYYNSYGPSHYYPLLSQGAQGEGDKETFLAATLVTQRPYYQVARFVGALGNVRDEKFNGNAMAQFDPVQDLEFLVEKHKLRKKLSGDEYKEAVLKLPQPRQLFVHANTPKLDPWAMMKEKDTVNEKGERFRLYGNGMRVRTGMDFEKVYWEHMNNLLCDLNLQLDYYKKVDRRFLCHEIRSHMEFLDASVHVLE